MSHTFYNSLDLTCKSPFGAVKAGQPVTFNLTVPEDLGYVDPHLVLTKDREDPVHYRMEFTGQTPKVNHFALTVTPTTSGLYFYHFDLYTDFRRIYRTPGGEGVLSWTDGQDWQLTVYEPDFKTPDWLKNGTMYQIFPDRFCEGKPNKEMPFADRIYRADKTGEPYFWPTEQSEGYLNMDYYGGDFAGIQQKLPYLEELGVTCIYLNPIFEAHANHRYNTANYLKADPLLGTNEDFAALWQAIAAREIYVLSDEVYEHICFAEGGHASVLAHPQLRERAVAVSSFGKTFHMTGWKVGYCVAPAAISAELRKVHQYLTFSVNTPAQLAIADMLREAPEHYRELPAFYRERRDLFIEALRPSRLEILPCEGTYFLLADYSAISDLDDFSFCRWLTTEIGVAAIPLSVFCADPFPHKLIRLCFAKQPATLLAAAARLCQL